MLSLSKLNISKQINFVSKCFKLIPKVAGRYLIELGKYVLLSLYFYFVIKAKETTLGHRFTVWINLFDIQNTWAANTQTHSVFRNFLFLIFSPFSF